MEPPLASSGIGRRLQPAERRDGIGASVLVDIAGPDPVTVRSRADDMLLKLSSCPLIPDSLSTFGPELWKNFIFPPVIIQIHKERELRTRRWSLDLMIQPSCRRPARV